MLIQRMPSANCLFMENGKVNEFNPEFFSAFHNVLDELELEAAPLILGSRKKAFSAGLDLIRLLRFEREALAAFIKEMDHLLLRLLRYPAPVVAAVEGPALAGGAILALCADLTLARPDARMGLTETAVGLPFPAVAEAIATLNLAPQRIREILVLGHSYTGEELLHTGFAARLHPDPVQAALAIHWPEKQSALAIKQDLAESIEERARHKAHLDAEFVEHWFSPEGQKALTATVQRIQKKS